MAKPKFLIIGGGFAGVNLARQLHGVADVTLVDRCGYNLHALLCTTVMLRVACPVAHVCHPGMLLTLCQEYSCPAASTRMYANCRDTVFLLQTCIIIQHGTHIKHCSH